MNTTVMAAIIVGLLVLATLGVVNFVKAESAPAKTTTASGPTCGATGGCSAGCSHTAGAEGSCGCGASCGCSGTGGCGCKAK